jgi:tRNA 2-thiouridine synthesizing protein B
MLHLVFQLPVDYSVLKRIDSGDDIVFLENAIFILNKNAILKGEIQRLLNSNIRLYVLIEDVEIRGIGISELVMGIEAIDFFRLVELTEKNELIRTWN